MTPTLTSFERFARVEYEGPDRRTLDPGTVLEVHPDPTDPDAVCVSVLWDDEDKARTYTINLSTLYLWRPLATEDATPSGVAEQLTAADAALAHARSTHTPRSKSPEHLEALEALAARLRDLRLAIESLPWARDGEHTMAGESEALNPWREAAAMYVADAAAVVWDAWNRQTHASRGMADPVLYDVTTLPLGIADRALAVARHTLIPDDDEPLSPEDIVELVQVLAAVRNPLLS